MNKSKIKESVYEILIEEGLITSNISRQGIINVVGRYRYDKAIDNGKLKQVNKTTKNETKYYDRNEFKQLLINSEI